MSSDMTNKSALYRESLGTVAAVMWSFSSLNPYMFLKSNRLRKSLVTLTTLIWFVTSMSSHMANKSAIFRESLVTLAALIFCELIFATSFLLLIALLVATGSASSES